MRHEYTDGDPGNADGPSFDEMNRQQEQLLQLCKKQKLDGTAFKAEIPKREKRLAEKRTHTDIERSVAEIIADTKIRPGAIVRAVGFISYTCDDMLNGLRLKRQKVEEKKEAVDKKKEDAKAKLEEKAKGILEGADAYDKWTKEKLLTVLKYKAVPGVTIQMDKEALRTAYENTLPLA